MGISFVLFPMLAKASGDGDRDAISRYVENGVRAAALISGGLVAVTSALAPELLSLVFSREASNLAGESMRILVCGLGAFALFGTFVTVLNSLKQQWQSLLATSAALLIVVGLVVTLVRGQPLGNSLLVSAATGTAAAMGLAALLTGWLVRRSAGRALPLATLLRVLVALAAGIGVAELLPLAAPEQGKLTLALTVCVEAVAILITYAGVLTLLRELRRTDVEALRAIVQRRPRS
jgi:O-antigen/teichoic acid export membrane protein